MALFIPELIGGEPNKIFKMEFLGLLNKMNIKMDEDDFEKLWKKFDQDNSGYVKSQHFLKKLGVHQSNDNNDEYVDSARQSKASSIPFAQFTG
jgi:Ca2+-binding EF-hand superfamily protein